MVGLKVPHRLDLERCLNHLELLFSPSGHRIKSGVTTAPPPAISTFPESESLPPFFVLTGEMHPLQNSKQFLLKNLPSASPGKAKIQSPEPTRGIDEHRIYIQNDSALRRVCMDPRTENNQRQDCVAWETGGAG